MATRDELMAMAREAGFMPVSAEWFECFPEEIERFVKLVERRKCNELAAKVERMPFGDTAASFALWIRSGASDEHKPEELFRKWPKE